MRFWSNMKFEIFIVAINTFVLCLCIFLRNYLAAVWILAATYWYWKHQKIFYENWDLRRENLRLMLENTSLLNQNTLFINKIKEHVEKKRRDG